MKRFKLVLCLFAYAALASACSGFGNKEAKKEEPKMEEKLTINQHAELVMSKTLPAFGVIDFESMDDAKFEVAIHTMEQALDSAYDYYETLEQKRLFSEALYKAVVQSDASEDVKIIYVSHIKAY